MKKVRYELDKVEICVKQNDTLLKLSELLSIKKEKYPIVGRLYAQDGNYIFPLELSDLETLTNCTMERFLNQFRKGMSDIDAYYTEIVVLAKKINTKKGNWIEIQDDKVAFIRPAYTEERKKNGVKVIFTKDIVME